MDFSAIVLAGGKSSRMGEDKRRLLLNDHSLIEHAVHSLLNLSDDIIISANDQPGIDLPFRYIPDISQGLGPLGGLISTLPETRYPQSIVISCDMPFIQKEHLKKLIADHKPGKINVFSHEGKIQPFPGIYLQYYAEKMKALLSAGKLSMRYVLEYLNAHILDSEGRINPDSFLNINSPGDLGKARDM